MHLRGRTAQANTRTGSLRSVAGPAWSDEDLERIRRSVAMLEPGRRDGLDRDTALGLLAELQALRRDRTRLVAVIRDVRALVATAAVAAYPAAASPRSALAPGAPS